MFYELIALWLQHPNALERYHHIRDRKEKARPPHDKNSLAMHLSNCTCEIPIAE